MDEKTVVEVPLPHAVSKADISNPAITKEQYCVIFFIKPFPVHQIEFTIDGFNYTCREMSRTYRRVLINTRKR